MKISVDLISTIEEADSLLKIAQRDRRYYNNRRESIDLSAESSEESALKTQQELASVKAQLSYINNVIDSLPEGDLKYDEVTKKMALEVRLRKLTVSGNREGAFSLLEKEYDANALEGQITSIEAFIAAVSARRAAL
jgi:hypothetical protein